MRTSVVEQVFRDLRYVVRALLRSPIFTPRFAVIDALHDCRRQRKRGVSRTCPNFRESRATRRLAFVAARETSFDEAWRPMKAWRFAMRSWIRGLRAGRLTVLMIALTVAVAAITTVGFFIDRVGASVAREAAGVLAADLRLRADDPLNPDYLAEAERQGLTTAQVAGFPTVLLFRDSTQLGSLYAVSDRYPLRGQVRIADTIDSAAYATTGGPAPGRIWVEAGLLARLGADVGDAVRVGVRELNVERILKHRPDQSMGFDTFAPSLLMNLADLESTNLVRPGSRVGWAQLFAGEPPDVERFREWLDEARQQGEFLQSAGRTEERIQRSIDGAGSFLSLASMITLLLAATAVAVSARRYAATQVDGVALLKCLGAKQSLVLTMTLLELAFIGITTGIVGSVLGFVAQLGLANLVGDLIEVELPAPGWAPAATGMLVALAVLAGFALPAMLTLRPCRRFACSARMRRRSRFRPQCRMARRQPPCSAR